MSFTPGLLALPLLLLGCSSEDGKGSTDGAIPVPDAVEDVHFAEHIAPILERNCTVCHHADSAIGYDFTDVFNPDTGILMRENSWFPGGSSYEFIVVPGKPDESSLVAKISDPNLVHDSDGDPMPFIIDSLAPAEIELVEKWIQDGANNDTFFTSNVAPLFGTEVSLRRVSGKCTWCHYPGSPTGMSVLDVFDPDTGMVNADSNAGGKIVVPGDPSSSVLMTRLRGTEGGRQMPLQLPRLSESEVSLFVEWIAEGAKND